MNTNFSYQSRLRMKHQEFISLNEFIEFLNFLGLLLNGKLTVINATFDSDEYTYCTEDFTKFIEEMKIPNSIYSVTISILSDETKIDLTYTSLYLIKNNSSILVSSNSAENVREIKGKINEELRKYQNPIRRNLFKGLSTFVALVLFLSMFSSIVPFNRFTDQDFSFSSSLFFDLLLVTALPVFISFFLYQAYVPTIRIKSNRGFFNAIKAYLTRDYKSIIKDIVIAAIFLLLGLLIK